MALQSGYTGYYEGYNVTMLERLILWELGQVSGTTVSYDRFPKWLIRQKLTERQNIFAFKSQCLKKFALLVAKQGYTQYKLPLNCMDKGIIAIRYYTSSTSYEDIELRDTRYLDEHYPGWLAHGDGTPQIAYMGETYGNIPMIGIYQAPDANGTDYSLSPDTGIVIGDSFPGTITNHTGMATGGSCTTLTDSYNFVDLGIVAGMTINNVTDGSSATITVVADGQITHTALSGGSDNTFSAGDSYEILGGEYGVITSWTDEERYIFGSEVGLVSQITVPAGNFRVDYIPYPHPFSYDETGADANQGNDLQYPEIPKLYHQALAYGVISDLLSTFNEASKEFGRAQVYEQKFNDAIAEAMAAKNTRPFDQKEVCFKAARRK